jgi:hypothetical protein
VTSVVGQPVDIERAVDWVRGSLAQGSDLARLVGANLSTLANALLLVEPSRARGLEPILDDNGRGIPALEADEIAERLLARAAHRTAVTLIVEDDLARRGDPNVGRATFVADRVLRWEEVDNKARRAVSLLRRGASGYPLNAYLCQGSATDLGLTADEDLSPVRQQCLAEAVLGVIVSVWDAEALVAVVSSKLSD